MVRLWWNVLVANLATNFQDLVAKVKNLGALAPVLGAISRPAGGKLGRKGKACQTRDLTDQHSFTNDIVHGIVHSIDWDIVIGQLQVNKTDW